MYYLVRISHVWIDGPQVCVEVLDLGAVKYENEDIWTAYADTEAAKDIERILGDEPSTEDWPPGLYGLDLEEDDLLALAPFAPDPEKDPNA